MQTQVATLTEGGLACTKMLGAFALLCVFPQETPAAESDLVLQEVERIRMLYGQAGFLAWDLARGQANLPEK